VIGPASPVRGSIREWLPSVRGISLIDPRTDETSDLKRSSLLLLKESENRNQ